MQCQSTQIPFITTETFPTAKEYSEGICSYIDFYLLNEIWSIKDKIGFRDRPKLKDLIEVKALELILGAHPDVSRGQVLLYEFLKDSGEIVNGIYSRA
jgi:hypothetical protein